MQTMHDLLRSTLGRSLGALSPLDRLGAAWPVAAGPAVSGRSQVTALAGTVAIITVVDAAWQRQLQSTADQLRGDLARISRVPLTDILFQVPAGTAPPHRKPA